MHGSIRANLEPCCHHVKRHSREDVLQRFGTTLRELRLDARLSQEELAAKAGLDRTYVGGVERGERNIALVNICRLAGALDVPSSKLLANLDK